MRIVTTRTAGRVLLCVAVYVAATISLTWPLARDAATHVGFSGTLWHGDHLLVIWILRWGLHALATNPLGFLNANAFFPAQEVLARSELMLGLLPPYGVIYWLTGNPVLALNMLTLGSFVFSGLTMHLLVERWTGSVAAAYVAGLSFAFAPWRLMTVGGPTIGPPTGAVHLLQTQYLPLILLGLDACARRHSWLWLVLSALLLVVQTASTFYLGYMGFFLASMYLLALAVGARGEMRLTDVLFPAGAVVLGAVLVLPLALPYLRAQKGGTLTADWSDITRMATALLGTPRAIIESYAGVGAATLALLGVLFQGRRLAEPRPLALLLITVGSVLVARGPTGFFGGWVAPYAWLCAIVPGMTNIRVTWRFGILTGFAVSGLSGYGLRAVLARIPGTISSSLVAGAVMLAVLWPAVTGPPMVVTEVPSQQNVPAVYRWLGIHGEGGPLLELPVGKLQDEVLNGAEAMYFSTYHWLPILTGHTGYLPTSYQSLKPYFERLPDRQALQLLVDCTKLRWIIRHERPGGGREWGQTPELVVRGVFPDQRGTSRLYEVLARPEQSCPLSLAASPSRTIQ